jgi:hypothetical protein
MTSNYLLTLLLVMVSFTAQFNQSDAPQSLNIQTENVVLYLSQQLKLNCDSSNTDQNLIMNPRRRQPRFLMLFQWYDLIVYPLTMKKVQRSVLLHERGDRLK